MTENLDRFLRYQDKEYIQKSAYLLRGTKIGIADQFPKEISEAHKKLYPVIKNRSAMRTWGLMLYASMLLFLLGWNSVFKCQYLGV